MRIYVTGYQRSGNNWLTMLIAETIGADVSCVLKREDTGKKHKVVQVHHGPEMLQTKSPIVHIVRDPRDVAVSVWHYWPQKYGSINEVLESMRQGTVMLGHRWSEFVAAWLSKGVPMVRYEDLLLNTEQTLSRMFDGIGVAVFPAEITKAVGVCRFEMLRGQFPEEKAHFRAGRSGDWERYFNDQDVVLAEEYFGDVMRQIWD